jgi:hypothetical protein
MKQDCHTFSPKCVVDKRPQDRPQGSGEVQRGAETEERRISAETPGPSFQPQNHTVLDRGPPLNGHTGSFLEARCMRGEQDELVA